MIHRTGEVRVSGYEVCRAKAEPGDLANLNGRDAARMTAEIVHASLGVDGEIATISLKALKASISGAIFRTFGCDLSLLSPETQIFAIEERLSE